MAGGYSAAVTVLGGARALQDTSAERFSVLGNCIRRELSGGRQSTSRPPLSTDYHPKRWVVVRPPGSVTGILLGRADGERQEQAVGNQTGGRVGFFLRVDDFAATYSRLRAEGVEFVRPPRVESYGEVAVFLDIAGNRWDLIG